MTERPLRCGEVGLSWKLLACCSLCHVKHMHRSPLEAAKLRQMLVYAVKAGVLCCVCGTEGLLEGPVKVSPLLDYRLHVPCPSTVTVSSTARPHSYCGSSFNRGSAVRICNLTRTVFAGPRGVHSRLL